MAQTMSRNPASLVAGMHTLRDDRVRGDNPHHQQRLFCIVCLCCDGHEMMLGLLSLLLS